ncbi:group III truncated hemoglobin [Campylobacter lanienae]|uniref:group III truncated hemoglobin n=1 Tax=Campylobacter lanienae TaxID=75658 RepID=UPI000BB4280A|nr:group III truncated hemoglobin [Campylobacter lanienae]
MKYKEITNESIAELMESFYEAIREDESGLGEIFNNKIGTSEEAWDAHKAKIGEFWKGMLIGQSEFRGNPMQAHMNLDPFPPEYFDNWLNLFKESLDSIYEPEIADMILMRAQMIANRFKSILYAS